MTHKINLSVQSNDTMSTTQQLIDALKHELKISRTTYAELAKALGMAESSVKRIFSKGDMTLSRVDEICRALQIDFTDLAKQVVEAQPEITQLTLEQERAVTSDKKLMVVAICVLSHWTFEQIITNYRISEPECIKYFAQLDRLGVIELRPMNRYQLKLSKTFRWLPNGPVMQFFREYALLDYFAGNFNQEDENLTLTFGNISPSAVPTLIERMQKIALDFAQQHHTDSKIGSHERKGYTMVMGIRKWELELLSNLTK